MIANLENEHFGVSELADVLGISRSHLFRRLKKITSQSANQYLRDVRLEEAVKLLAKDELTVSQIAYKVGFGSPSYFNKCFHDKYGYSPGEYQSHSIKNQPDESPNDKREKSLKRKPYFLWAAAIAVILVITLIWQFPLTPSEPETHKSSIAVLPLLDLSENRKKEHIAVGLTDAIILELSRLKNLRVISRGSAMLFRDTDRLYSEVADQLGVKLLLEGSIVFNEDSVKVTVQLIEPLPEEKHLWANKYEQSYSNLIHLSNDISNAIAHEINLVVNSEFPALPQTKSDAYEWYLKARHLWLQNNPKSLILALDCLNEALAIDSAYAPAYSLKAECFIGLNRFIRNNEEKLKNRESSRVAIAKALNKAIELDGSLSEAYITKGNVLGKFDYNWDEMRFFVEKGIDLNPNNSNGYISLSDYYVIKGDLPHSIKMALKAEQLDPLNPKTLCLVADRYVLAEEYDKAIKQYNNVLDLFPNYGFAWDGLGYAYYMKKDKNNALKAWTELHRIFGNDDLVRIYENESFEKGIRYWLKQTTSGDKLYCSNPSIIAMVHLFVEDKNGAMEYLDLAYKYKHLDLPFMMLRPNFKLLHEDVRFQEMSKKIGINMQYYP
ncbi:helix-turn-helix domain-containing protein [Marinilabilia rubra]|uniref:helix-turn-helix domain-containing protein n=1 Tax=Marinilabilia rubra TaxID=2162893 RepID=UPI001304FEC1|nr:helix-turn-helix domain-containing protein [Marinilabilia rubra]